MLQFYQQKSKKNYIEYSIFHLWIEEFIRIFG